MESVSIFKNFAQLVEDKALSDIIFEIQDGKYMTEVEAIRKLIADDKTKEADALKKKLLGFTPSGTFDNGRKAELISTYSGFIVLDLDKLTETQLEEVKVKATQIAFTYAVFVSPGGNGLKIIIPVNTQADNHKLAMLQVATYYEKAFQITVDPSGKDVSRLCFMSYDPDCYFNPNAETFSINLEPFQSELPVVKAPIPNKVETTSPQVENPESTWQEKFFSCIEFTEKKATFIQGNRNNFVHLLACNCNRIGMPESIAQNYISQHYNLDKSETITSVASAYKNNIHEHAKFANIANYTDNTKTDSVDNTTSQIQTDSKDSQLLAMPYLPDEIFENLPEILKKGCDVFTNRRQRDVFLTGALSILSGCMRNFIGLYNGDENRANLYSFVVAPAASGKKSLVSAKALGSKYHKKLVNESEAKKKIYESEMQVYKKKLYDKKVHADELEMPKKPPYKVLYIPANNSSARLIQHLRDGDQQGIFCETEADSMGNVLKQDWGGYSDLLRKAFHHEPISYSRKTNDEFVEIDSPCLSVALAGTPGQVVNLIKSSEDGLFSRFLFYTFKSELAWIKASEKCNGVNLTSHFDELSYEVLSFVEFIESMKRIEIKLTLNQWERLNEFGENSLITLTCFFNEDLASTSKRLGLILLRICMVLTGLKYYDFNLKATEFLCADEDFEIALKLVKVYEQHAVFMFNELPKSTTGTDKALKKFFDLLPDKFQRKEAIELALNKLQIKERTADGYLSKLLTSKLLDNPRSGHYEKIKK